MDGRLVAFLARVVPGSALVLGVGSLIRQQLTPACYNQPIIPERYRVADNLRRPLADMVAAAELRRAAPTAACAPSTHHLAIDSWQPVSQTSDVWAGPSSGLMTRWIITLSVTIPGRPPSRVTVVSICSDRHKRGEGGIMRRTSLVLLLLIGLVTVPWTASAGAASQPTCFGEAATIVGSGVIVGTSGNDVIVGSAANDDIQGGDGDDRVCALQGSDVLGGGLGDDRVDGGPGDDRIVGEFAATQDNVTVDGGDDLLLGGPGDDRITGDFRNFAGAGEVSGAGGNDTIEGGRGRDSLIGDSGAIIISGNGGNDTLDSGPDDDFAVGGDSNAQDLASGDGGDDTMTGGPGNDGFLIGDNGVFTCEGVITGDGGNDVISGGAGNDAPIVGDADPVCGVPTGTAGDDSLFGDDGDDQLHGDNFTDTGNPVFDSGTGNDTCDGGAGTDTAVNCERLAGIP